jgi:hypothetical protein
MDGHLFLLSASGKSLLEPPLSCRCTSASTNALGVSAPVSGSRFTFDFPIAWGIGRKSESWVFLDIDPSSIAVKVATPQKFAIEGGTPPSGTINYRWKRTYLSDKLAVEVFGLNDRKHSDGQTIVQKINRELAAYNASSTLVVFRILIRE